MAKTKSQSQASKKLKMQHRHDLKPLQHSQTSHQFLPISQQQTKRKIKIHQNNRKKKKKKNQAKFKIEIPEASRSFGNKFQIQAEASNLQIF